MEAQSVIVETAEQIRIVTINREHRRNAFDPDTLRRLLAALKGAETHGLSAIVLTGAGTIAFSAGGDIKAYASMTHAELAASTDLAQELFSRMQGHPVPLIAAIEGYCLGGGLELALGCDLRIAGASATFGLPEVSVNALPSVGGYQLARYIGVGRAEEMVVFGRRVNAEEALAWGLIAEVVPRGSALPRAISLARQLAGHADRSTIARAKAMVRFGSTASDRTGRYLSLLLDEVQTSSDAFRAGVSGFAKS